MPRPAAFLAPWQPSEGPVSELERLLAMLPDTVYRKDDGLLVSILAAIAAELERARGTLAEEGLQGFPSTATWALDRWERQLGLSNGAGMTTAKRRTRALARRRGLTLPIGRYMQERTQDALPHATELPTIACVKVGHWAVFKPVEQGWPGDEAFREAERRLRVAGPAGDRFWLAPHDTTLGLAKQQVNQMARAAANCLSRVEVDGA